MEAVTPFLVHLVYNYYTKNMQQELSVAGLDFIDGCCYAGEMTAVPSADF